MTRAVSIVVIVHTFSSTSVFHTRRHTIRLADTHTFVADFYRVDT